MTELALDAGVVRNRVFCEKTRYSQQKRPTLRHFGFASVLWYRKHGNVGQGNAVSLAQNNQSSSMRDVTIARLIVGTGHCLLVSTSSLKALRNIVFT
jgi:hypothetical protein